MGSKRAAPLREAMELDPKFAFAHFGLGTALLSVGWQGVEEQRIALQRGLPDRPPEHFRPKSVRDRDRAPLSLTNNCT